MTLEDHGKKIKEVWFPGEGNAYNERIQSKDGIELQLSATNHGDRDEFWVSVKEGGLETRVVNLRQATEVVWQEP